MKALVFYTPNINHDEFGKEARKFAKCHNIPKSDMIAVDTKKLKFQERRALVMQHLRKRDGQLYDCIAFFCHGWYRKLQLGFRMISVPVLGRRISAMSTVSVKVLLYACNTAKDDHTRLDAGCGLGEDGGFAHELRDSIAVAGATSCRVFGHDTAGHTTRNPYVVVHWSSSAYRDARYIIRPRGPYWRKWIEELKHGDFRFRFPFMTNTEIENAIK
jgi:hypothetical protein